MRARPERLLGASRLAPVAAAHPPDQYPGIVVLRLPDTPVALEIARVLALLHETRISGITRVEACDCRSGPGSFPSPIELGTETQQARSLIGHSSHWSL
jgi:hypothetical protein